MTDKRSYHVTVDRVVDETSDARSLVLSVPADAHEQFTYRPGQYLTVRIPSDRTASVARCYSLASTPGTGEAHKVTVKRTLDGYASNWICDNVKPGDRLEVLPPAGTFVPESLDDDLLLVAGGSGITPVISIAKAALHHGAGHVVLVYGNRDERSVIFRDELNELVAGHPDRLHVIHWLESVQGLPSLATLRALFGPHADREVFVCGPPPFMANVDKVMCELGVPDDRVHFEEFVSLTDDPMAAPPDAAEADLVASVEVTLDGQTHELAWPSNRKLLDLLLDNGIDAPYSCREGRCSACACVLLDGDVSMDNNEILEDVDLEDGLFLSCQARPMSPTVRASYDG